MLRAKVCEADLLLPPVKGWEFYDCGNWESDSTMECSREVSPAGLDSFVKKKKTTTAGSLQLKERRIDEEERKEIEQEARREQPLAAEVDTAARKGDLARVKQLQQLKTCGNAIIIIITLSLNYYKIE